MEIAYQAWSETFGSELYNHHSSKDTDYSLSSLNEVSSPSLDAESNNSTDSAFHTPSFGDEDFSVENQSLSSSSPPANHKAEQSLASETSPSSQLSISCTAQVALVQQPYSNSGYNNQQQQQPPHHPPYPIEGGSPPQLNPPSVGYNSGSLQHQQQSLYQPPYSNSVNRYLPYQSGSNHLSQQPPHQQLANGGCLGYSNTNNSSNFSNNSNSSNNGVVGSGFHHQPHHHLQYYTTTPGGHQAGGYLASLNPSYVTGGSVYNTNPQFPPQNYFEIPDINGDNYYHHQLAQQQQEHYSSYIPHPHHHSNGLINPAYIPTSYYNTGVMAQREPILSTMDEGRTLGYNNTTLDKNSSDDSDDNLPLTKLTKGKTVNVDFATNGSEIFENPNHQVAKRKRGGGNANTRGGGNAGGEGKKPKTPKKRKKKDPNEPVKPVSAYAMFFRDTQAAIKSENPKATFGEVSKIVASMWDGLNEDSKSDYKQRTEIAKKEYLQKLAVYRASLVSQGAEGGASVSPEISPLVSPEKNQQPPQQPVAIATTAAASSSPPTAGYQSPQQQPEQTSLATEQQEQQSLDSASGESNSPPPGQEVATEMNRMSPPHKEVDMEESKDVNTKPEENAAPADNPVESNHVDEPNAISANSFYGKSQPPADSPSSGPQCTRSGCEKESVPSPLWDNEYCSNQCVVEHCRDVFTAWVSSRSGYASVN